MVALNFVSMNLRIYSSIVSKTVIVPICFSCGVKGICLFISFVNATLKTPCMKCFKHGVLNTMHTVSASGFNLCFARLVFDNEKLQATERVVSLNSR